MNLHAIAGPYISAVNPMLPVTVRVSLGSTTLPSGKRSPNYALPYRAQAQVQAMSSRDLRQVSGLNLQGSMSAIYLMGDIEGIVRPLVKGGDLITFPDSSVYLVVVALENWGASGTPTEQWSKVAAQLQSPPIPS
jgi:hypothetical protein